MSLMTMASARLGARFCIVWDPCRRQLKHGGCGAPYARVAQLRVGLEIDGVRQAFPFARDVQSFDILEQEQTPNSITWRGFLADTGTMLEMRVTAPFYPQDRRVSLLPAFYIDLRVSDHGDLLREHHNKMRTGHRPSEPCPRGRLFFEFERPGIEPLCGDHATLRFGYDEALHEIDPEWNPLGDGGAAPEQARVEEGIRILNDGATIGDMGFTFDFDLDAGRDSLSLVWVAHTTSAFIDSEDGPSQLAYIADFPDFDTAMAAAVEERERNLDLSDAFDRLFEQSSLGTDYTEFFALTMQWLFINTWWLRNAHGDEWFTVTEGKCLYLSTVDVEYNVALFYLAFWPELLRMQLERWTAVIDDEGYLHHDIGRLPCARGQSYPHAMACEECANWLLMLAGYWSVTGDKDFVRRVWPHAETLTHYLLDADTTGNGMPDQGTANTIDDASTAVQFASENVYIAVKSYAGLCAARALGEAVDQSGLDARIDERERRFLATFENEAWLGDHYATCLVRAGQETTVYKHQAGALVGDTTVAQDTHEDKVAEVPGWDAYSLYTANGLLYLQIAGIKHGLRFDRLRLDMTESHRRSLSSYGCYHSSVDHSNLWISQNLWRDAIGGYLGIDLLENIQRYLKFERMANTQGLSRGFVDTYGWNNLHSYPRGIACVGLLFGQARLTVNREREHEATGAARVPECIPLCVLADWPARRVPYLISRLQEDRAVAERVEMRI